MAPLPFTAIALAVAAALATGTVAAQAPPAEAAGDLAEVVVFGRAEHLIGEAGAASEGAVGGADLSVRPMLRVAELLEAVPGLIAAQHSGSGKANQYFLRGFNLDHGTDFTTYVDGMPWNLRSHGHGQGYLDVNGLIPETVARIDYRKGPYRADVGDFALAGAAFMSTIDRLDEPFVAIEGGQYGWGRLAAGGTTTAPSGGELTGLAQLKTYDGPWQRPEALRHGSVWGKYADQTAAGRLELTLSGYHATWQPTEQSPEIAVGTAACPDRYCSLDQTATWTASAYLQRYDWRMISNPTYDFQIGQFDRRWTVGGRGIVHLVDDERFEVDVGTELRYDNGGGIGVDHTENGRIVDNISDNTIREGSAAAFTEATWHATDRLRFVGAARGDYYDFSVSKNLGAGDVTVDGQATSTQVSPKGAIAYTVNDSIELYGNWGRGFHSNDARGVVNATTPVPGLVRGTGY
ncbi:MAG: TonB-dependent receptor, partial [Proteobacteria bacterium]